MLQQQFNPLKPNQVWVSDITMFRLKEKNFYICVILDLYSRAVVGYKIGIKNSTQLTKSTFKLAYINRRPQSGWMFHSDNGDNYCCRTFQTYLIKLNVEQSFSRPYVPYDNSVMESFFASMKRDKNNIQVVLTSNVPALDVGEKQFIDIADGLNPAF